MGQASSKTCTRNSHSSAAPLTDNDRRGGVLGSDQDPELNGETKLQVEEVDGANTDTLCGNDNIVPGNPQKQINFRERERTVRSILSELNTWKPQELGLGRGIDGTNPNPWASKLALQIREPKLPAGENEGSKTKQQDQACHVQQHQSQVPSQDTLSSEGGGVQQDPAPLLQQKSIQESSCDSQQAPSDSQQSRGICNLICTDEGGTLTNFINEVSSVKQQQARFNLSVTAPNIPLTVDTGVDMSRSRSLTQMSIGKRIYTKTIAFKATFDGTEERLAKDILEFAGHKKIADETYVKSLVGRQSCQEDCENFVCRYHVTHYVNSITLGASRFVMKSESKLDRKVSVSGSGGYQSVARAGASVTFVDKLLKKSESQQSVGTMNEISGTVESEAVVEASFEPISNLAMDIKFRELLKKALARYIKKQQEKLAGPFYISCNDTKVFLKVIKEQNGTFSVSATNTKEQASHFYIIMSDHPYKFYIGWKGDHCHGNVEQERDKSTMCYLQEHFHGFCRHSCSYKLERYGIRQHGLFSIQDPLTTSKYAQHEKIKTEAWLNGYNSNLIRSSRRNWRFDGYFAVKETLSNFTGTVQYTSFCKSNAKGADKGNTHMAFRLHPESTWTTL